MREMVSPFKRDFGSSVQDLQDEPIGMQIHTIYHESALNNLGEGQSMVDLENERKLIKLNGKFYEETVENDKVKLKEI